MDELADVLGHMKEYILQLNHQFEPPQERKLDGGTPVAAFSSDEFVMITRFLTDYAKQGKLAGRYEFGHGANPYITIGLGWWHLLQEVGKKRGKSIVWVTTTGTMKAKTQLNLFSLRVLDFPQIISWGDLTAALHAKPKLLDEVILIGDVDFEQGNKTLAAISSDGKVRHDETVRCIRKIAKDDPKCDLTLFHRTGWNAAVDIHTL